MSDLKHELPRGSDVRVEKAGHVVAPLSGYILHVTYRYVRPSSSAQLSLLRYVPVRTSQQQQLSLLCRGLKRSAGSNDLESLHQEAFDEVLHEREELEKKAAERQKKVPKLEDLLDAPVPEYLRREVAGVKRPTRVCCTPPTDDGCVYF